VGSGRIYGKRKYDEIYDEIFGWFEFLSPTLLKFGINQKIKNKVMIFFAMV
tara:strand:- start:12126 stop:12278 length:153 start_codon:yes stop_codon:yes gene_type:complete